MAVLRASKCTSPDKRDDLGKNVAYMRSVYPCISKTTAQKYILVKCEANARNIRSIPTLCATINSDELSSRLPFALVLTALSTLCSRALSISPGLSPPRPDPGSRPTHPAHRNRSAGPDPWQSPHARRPDDSRGT